MKERLAKLLSVKSIVTIFLTIIFGYMCITNQITADQFLTIFSVVIAFYFGTQAVKE